MAALLYCRLVTAQTNGERRKMGSPRARGCDWSPRVCSAASAAAVKTPLVGLYPGKTWIPGVCAAGTATTKETSNKETSTHVERER